MYRLHRRCSAHITAGRGHTLVSWLEGIRLQLCARLAHASQTKQKWPACVASDHPELFVAALALQCTAGAPALSSSCTSSPRPASLVLSVVKIVLLPHKNQKKQGGVDKALLKAKFHSSTLRFGPYGRAPGSTP